MSWLEKIRPSMPTVLMDRREAWERPVWWRRVAISTCCTAVGTTLRSLVLHRYYRALVGSQFESTHQMPQPLRNGCEIFRGLGDFVDRG